MQFKIITKVFLFSSLVCLLPSSNSAVVETSKTCIRTETFNVTTIVADIQPKRVRSSKWCASARLKCDMYETKMEEVNTTQVITKVKNIPVCCPGYIETFDGTKCIPFCEQSCVQGECTSPGTCTCAPNYDGTTCNHRVCPEGKWGENCTEPCTCIGSDSKCNITTGTCDCGIGRTGERCETKCKSNSYGRDCKEKCYCQNRGTCHPSTGFCSCQPGWQGVHCELPCSEGTHGLDCEDTCNCPSAQNVRCDPPTGNCTCSAGWHGQTCTTPCPVGLYGVNCEFRCDCKNNATCDTVHGKCLCQPGFSGGGCERLLRVIPRLSQAVGTHHFFPSFFLICSVLFHLCRV